MPSDTNLLKMQAAARRRHKRSASDLLKVLGEVGLVVKEKPVIPAHPKKEVKEKKIIDEKKKEVTQSKTDHSVRSDDFKKRAPAVYDNIPSPYGIATELLMEQLKKSG